MDVRQKLRTYFVEELDEKSITTLGDDDSLLARGILDSIAIMKLTMYLEKAFGIQVGDGDVVPENFETLNSIQRYVEAKRGPA